MRKYEEIAETLRAEIASPSATTGRSFPSERELTERFAVDRSTVRRALELLEEEGLILRRPGRKTQVVGGANVRPVTRRVAFVVNASPRGWATLPTMHGAESVLTPHGLELSILSTYAENPFQAERRERERLEYCLTHRVAGVLLWSATRQGSQASLERLREAGIPVVLVDHQLPAPELDFVGIDNVAAAYSATRHLIQAGHRKIAHFSRANTMPTTLQRIEGYCRALEDHGLAFEESWLKRCAPGADETRALDVLLAEEDRPTALFAINDMTALRLLHHLAKRRVRVPEAMAVVGIDDLPVAELAAVPLTTVHQPFEEIGAEAARLLLDRIDGRGKAPVEARLIPTRLVVRASCGASPTPAEATPFY